MNRMVKKIKKMHNKFGIPCEQVAFSDEEEKFRITAMQEELDEYIKAENDEEAFDALIDLVVFALGTAERRGWLHNFEEGFDRVMFANMLKEVGKNQKRGNFALDLIKPDYWEAPDHSDLVKEKPAPKQTVMEFIKEQDDD
jgi:hypothetical protein